ncbi:MAG: hypothetical protein R3E01_16390 [Pirellulaceae bacterium]|nr:hypothetical protein [Planctomycetales bacterium]
MKLLQSRMFWGLAYSSFLAMVVGGMIYGRQWAQRNYGTAVAQQEWESWRATARENSGEDDQPVQGPVQRRTPQSPGPPALLLMRDYFWTCLLFVVFLGSILFFVTAALIRGVTCPATNMAER